MVEGYGDWWSRFMIKVCVEFVEVGIEGLFGGVVDGVDLYLGYLVWIGIWWAGCSIIINESSFIGIFVGDVCFFLGKFIIVVINLFDEVIIKIWVGVF